MTRASPFSVSAAGPEHGEALERLFSASCFGCYCRFWHFAGNAKAWQMRCAQAPELNAAEMRAALASGSLESRGLVAHAATGELAGWLKLSPASHVQKLYDQRLYRGLPCFAGDRSTVYTVGCVLVREEFRRHGVARALIAAAVEHATAAGARSLEAFPRADADVADAALMMGPLSVFRELGFSVLHDFFPYPVLRKELHPAS